MILTVTVNAAVDKTLTVANLQLGHRHRAQQGLVMAGGKGVNVARALKQLGEPVIATGLAGGRTGTQIIESISAEGVLNDFLRIAGESRTSTAVVDPTSGVQTEINEYGPEVTAAELDALRDKLRYLSGAISVAVFAGSLPRKVDNGFYAEMVREMRRRKVRTALDTDGEPLRLSLAAEPELVSPNQREAEALVGHEFQTDEDFQLGLDQIAEMGAQNVVITLKTGCYALLRTGRNRDRRYRAWIPREIFGLAGNELHEVGSMDGRSDPGCLGNWAAGTGAISLCDLEQHASGSIGHHRNRHRFHPHHQEAGR